MISKVDNAISNLTGHLQILPTKSRAYHSVENHIPDPTLVLNAISPHLPDSAKTSARVRVNAVLSTARKSYGVILVGIDPQSEKSVSFIGTAYVEGRIFDPDENNGLLMGRRLMERLNIRLGNKVVLASQDLSGEVAAKAFRIRGVYQAELKSTENSIVFVPIKALQKMLSLGFGATEIAIALPGQVNLDTDLTPLGNSIKTALPDDRLAVFDWHQMLPSISAYMRVFDGVVLIAYIIAFVAMGFGIANTVLMAVYERMREFGLLKALGMRPFKIIQMILLETAILLLIGMAFGNSAGFAGIYYLSNNGVDLTTFSNATDLFGYSRIIYPVVIKQDIFLANAVVFLLGLLVGLYPAIKAARFMPVDIMRQR